MDFILPATLIWRLLQRFSDDVPMKNSYAPDVLTLRVLDHMYAGDVPDELRRYMDALPDTPRFALAQSIAECLDRYILYRPEWINDWQKGQGSGNWQASLWRSLAGDDRQHWAALVSRAVLQLQNSSGQEAWVNTLPERIHFFAVSAMSPGYVELLKALSRYIEINLFVFGSVSAVLVADTVK